MFDQIHNNRTDAQKTAMVLDEMEQRLWVPKAITRNVRQHPSVEKAAVWLLNRVVKRLTPEQKAHVVWTRISEALSRMWRS